MKNKSIKKFKKICKRKKKLAVRNHANKTYRYKQIGYNLKPLHTHY